MHLYLGFFTFSPQWLIAITARKPTSQDTLLAESTTLPDHAAPEGLSPLAPPLFIRSPHENRSLFMYHLALFGNRCLCICSQRNDSWCTASWSAQGLSTTTLRTSTALNLTRIYTSALLHPPGQETETESMVGSPWMIRVSVYRVRAHISEDIRQASYGPQPRRKLYTLHFVSCCRLKEKTARTPRRMWTRSELLGS